MVLSRRRTKRSRGAQERDVVIRAASSRTGIVHVFSSLKGLEELSRTFERKNFEQRTVDLVNAVSFWNGIKSQAALTFGPDITWTDPFYRVCWGSYDPLSIAGSLATGGRFNVGGAQVHSELPEVKMCGALYGASTLNCALAEAGPAKGATRYEIRLKEPLTLWDLERVIRHFARPSLDEMVRAAPMNAKWEMQKVPLIPQLLGHHLRVLGGNGLVFPSTKDPSGSKVLALFVSTDDESKQRFEATEIP